MSPEQVARIEDTVTQDFVDPESARFRCVRAVEVSLANGPREVRVCGEVNGKDRRDGYVGYKMFGGTPRNSC